MDVNPFGRAVVCGLQNHTGPEHAFTPAAGNLGNERYQPVDFIGSGRIRATGNLEGQRYQPVDFIGAGRTRAAGIRNNIEAQPDTFS